MTIKRSYLVILPCLLVYCILAFFVNKSMFDGGYSDGFYAQVAFAFSYMTEGGGFHPLYVVHIMRLFIVLPFYLIDLLELPHLLESLTILLYMYPVYKYSPVVGYRLTQLLYLILPFIFSYRTILVMCSISYLYICLNSPKPRYALFLFSALLANLSSGVILPWILIVLLKGRVVYGQYKKSLIVFVFAAAGFLVSVLHKIQHFFIKSGVSHDETFLSNNTFYVSVVFEQYDRLIIYSLLAILLFLLMMIYLYYSSSRLYGMAFLLGALPTLLFEGVGLVSFMIVFTWMIFRMIEITRRNNEA